MSFQRWGATLHIEERQGLEQREPDHTVAVRDGAVTLRIALPLPSVSLLVIRPAVR